MKWEEGKTSVKNKKRNLFGTRATEQGREGQAVRGGGRILQDQSWASGQTVMLQGVGQAGAARPSLSRLLGHWPA